MFQLLTSGWCCKLSYNVTLSFTSSWNHYYDTKWDYFPKLTCKIIFKKQKLVKKYKSNKRVEIKNQTISQTKWLSVRLRTIGCWFKSCYIHLNFRYSAGFDQTISCHSGHYRVWIHSKTRTWHEKKMRLEHTRFPWEKISYRKFRLHWFFLFRVILFWCFNGAILWTGTFLEFYLSVLIL